MNRRAKIRSITLDIKGRFETGRYQPKLFASRDDRLFEPWKDSSLFTMIKSVDNIPDWRERLQMYHIIEATTVESCLRNHVGIESANEDLDGERDKIL